MDNKWWPCQCCPDPENQVKKKIQTQGLCFNQHTLRPGLPGLPGCPEVPGIP